MVLTSVDAAYFFSVGGLFLSREFADDPQLSVAGSNLRLVFPSPDRTEISRIFDEIELLAPAVLGEGRAGYVTSAVAVIANTEVDLQAPGDVFSSEKPQALLDRFLEYVRTHGQQPSRTGIREAPMALGVVLFDEAGSPVGLRRVAKHQWIPAGMVAALTRELAEAFVASASMSEEPRLAESLYADARDGVHMHRKVLMAATSLEVAVKDMLIQVASSDQLPLLNLLLDSPRDYSASLPSLFHETCQTVCGRSLRELDGNQPKGEQTLYNTVCRLIINRNRIVHRLMRDLDSAQELLRQVGAAGHAHAWCRQVIKDVGDSKVAKGRQEVP